MKPTQMPAVEADRESPRPPCVAQEVTYDVLKRAELEERVVGEK